RRGRPILQEPVLGAADSKRRNCPGVRGVLSEVPEASISAAAVTRHAIAGRTEAEIATITGHSLGDVRSSLDVHYLRCDPTLAGSAIRTFRQTACPVFRTFSLEAAGRPLAGYSARHIGVAATYRRAAMHLQIFEAGERLTWRYVANGSHCWRSQHAAALLAEPKKRMGC